MHCFISHMQDTQHYTVGTCEKLTRTLKPATISSLWLEVPSQQCMSTMPVMAATLTSLPHAIRTTLATVFNRCLVLPSCTTFHFARVPTSLHHTFSLSHNSVLYIARDAATSVVCSSFWERGSANMCIKHSWTRKELTSVQLQWNIQDTRTSTRTFSTRYARAHHCGPL